MTMVAHSVSKILLSKSVPTCNGALKYQLRLIAAEFLPLYTTRQFSARPQLAVYTKISFKPTNPPSKTPALSTSSSSQTSLASPSPSSPTSIIPSSAQEQTITDITNGLLDEPLTLDEGTNQVDWTRSFHGLSVQPFSKEAAEILMAPITINDVEVKPDGIIYLPEIKYRRILNRAFGPGGWGLAPRGETIVTGKSITREYALVAHGRYETTISCALFPMQVLTT